MFIMKNGVFRKEDFQYGEPFPSEFSVKDKKHRHSMCRVGTEPILGNLTYLIDFLRVGKK